MAFCPSILLECLDSICCCCCRRRCGQYTEYSFNCPFNNHLLVERKQKIRNCSPLLLLAFLLFISLLSLLLVSLSFSLSIFCKGICKCTCTCVYIYIHVRVFSSVRKIHLYREVRMKLTFHLSTLTLILYKS